MPRPTMQSGFTLVEMIVSLAVFATVVTISVGALLVLIATNKQLQNEQSVMTNLSFALDSMAREIRTGSYYFCNSRPNTSTPHPAPSNHPNMYNPSTNLDGLGQDTFDCPDGRENNDPYHGIAFVEGGDSITSAANQRILYYHETGTGKIFRRVGDNEPQSIVSSGIYITEANFYVTGTDTLDTNSDTVQPTVTITLEARASDDASEQTHQIQTSVTQRTLDI